MRNAISRFEVDPVGLQFLDVVKEFFRTHGVKMAVSQLLLQIDVFIKHALHRVGVHIDGYCAFMNTEGIVGRGLGHGHSFVLVHLVVSAAGEKSCG